MQLFFFYVLVYRNGKSSLTKVSVWSELNMTSGLNLVILLLSSVVYAEMTLCMSPLSQDDPLQDKSCPSLGLIQEETEGINSIMGKGVSLLFKGKW